jgi:phenylacetate-CoA ligase
MRDDTSRAAAARTRWLETLDRYVQNRDAPGATDYWSPGLDTASREEIAAIQDAKVAAVVPFLYENSSFYRRRFKRLGLIPDDITNAADLVAKWPVVEKSEMATDAAEHPPYGTYTTIDDEIWAERGWMMFASSGSTGAPRVFRYSHVDREMGAWANARALHSMDFRHGDTVFMITGYGPHVWAWGVQYALEKMRLPVIPGGGMDARARANIIQRYKPTILLLTPSYALAQAGLAGDEQRPHRGFPRITAHALHDAAEMLDRRLPAASWTHAHALARENIKEFSSNSGSVAAPMTAPHGPWTCPGAPDRSRARASTKFL